MTLFKILTVILLPVLLILSLGVVTLAQESEDITVDVVVIGDDPTVDLTANGDNPTVIINGRNINDPVLEQYFAMQYVENKYDDTTIKLTLEELKVLINNLGVNSVITQGGLSKVIIVLDKQHDNMLQLQESVNKDAENSVNRDNELNLKITVLEDRFNVHQVGINSLKLEVNSLRDDLKNQKSIYNITIVIFTAIILILLIFLYLLYKKIKKIST